MDGKKTILVVDDEDIVRKLAAAFLKSAGYKVDLAASAEEALDQFGSSERPPCYDLVLSDVQMPGMNGVQLVEAIHRIRPDQRVILMSGRSAAALTDLGIVMSENVPLIVKPFHINELLEPINEMLA